MDTTMGNDELDDLLKMFGTDTVYKNGFSNSFSETYTKKRENEKARTIKDIKDLIKDVHVQPRKVNKLTEPVEPEVVKKEKYDKVLNILDEIHSVTKNVA